MQTDRFSALFRMLLTLVIVAFAATPALALNPKHPRALEMAGSAEYANGDYTSALRFWRPLLAVLEPGSQAHRELAAAIARTERLATMTIATQQQ